MAAPVTLNLQFINGIGMSGNLPTPSQYLFPDDYHATVRYPLTKMYPLEDSVTPVISWHRCAFVGMAWECPVRVLGGTGLRWATIESAPVGMTIGNGWVENVYGDLILNGDSLNLKWNSPVAGTYQIRVRVFDGTSSVTFRWTLIVSTASDGVFWFMSPTALGTGSGNSPENAASLVNTYLGDTTVSPSRNKILICRGGDYSGLNSISVSNPKRFNSDASYHSTNIYGYLSENAVFNTRFESWSNDRFFGNLEFTDMVLGSGGVIFCDPIRHRQTDYKLRFKRITAVQDDPDNQCMVNYRGGYSLFRDNLVTTQCEVVDCNVALVETYSIGSHLIDRNVATKSTNAPLSWSRPQFLFPKVDIKLCEMSFNRYDCPFTVSSNLIYCQNSSYHNVDETIILGMYNFLRAANGTQGYNLNKEAGQQNNISKCYMSHNTLIDCNVYPYIGEKGVGGGTFSILESEVYQNSFGGVAPSSVPPLGNYTTPNNELYGTSGIVDANGRIVNTTYRGRRGSQVWKA